MAAGKSCSLILGRTSQLAGPNMVIRPFTHGLSRMPSWLPLGNASHKTAGLVGVRRTLADVHVPAL